MGMAHFLESNIDDDYDDYDDDVAVVVVVVDVIIIIIIIIIINIIKPLPPGDTQLQLINMIIVYYKAMKSP